MINIYKMILWLDLWEHYWQRTKKQLFLIDEGKRRLNRRVHFSSVSYQKMLFILEFISGLSMSLKEKLWSIHSEIRGVSWMPLIHQWNSLLKVCQWCPQPCAGNTTLMLCFVSFIFCSRDKYINKQIKTQNTGQNIQIIFTFISHRNTFKPKNKRYSPQHINNHSQVF
jgi:hypothetical protein